MNVLWQTQCNSPFSENCGKTLPQNFGKTLVFLGYDKGKWDMIFGIFWVGFPMESQLQQVPFVTSECLCDEYDLSAPQASGSKCSIPPCECRGKNEAIYQSWSLSPWFSQLQITPHQHQATSFVPVCAPPAILGSGRTGIFNLHHPSWCHVHRRITCYDMLWPPVITHCNWKSPRILEVCEGNHP